MSEGSDDGESLASYPPSEVDRSDQIDDSIPLLVEVEPRAVDLDDLPSELQNEWGVPNSDVVANVHGEALDGIETLKLSALQRCYLNGSRHTAIYDILNPKRLLIDDKYRVAKSLQNRLTSKMVQLKMEDPRIDQTTFVGRYLGLGAIIPTVVSDDAWVFKLSLRNQDTAFSTKHTHLHFDVNCNGARLGKCNLESVWVFMVPDDYIDDTGEPIPPGECSGPPHMTKTHYRKFLLFLARCFERIHLNGVYCNDPYADVGTDQRFEEATNILRMPHHELGIPQVRALDKEMRAYYQPWLKDMPEDFEDDFFLENQPITVAYRYGQNKEIDPPGCTDGLQAMARNHDMAYIKYVSFATAIHASFERSSAAGQVKVVVPKDLDSITNPTYDHWLPDRRRRITKDTFAEFCKKPTQFTRPRLFTKDGEEVQFVHFSDPEVLPALWNLKRVKEEFAGEDRMDPEDIELDGISHDEKRTIPCYVYPLCFTGNLGNFQAHGPMHCMQGHIGAINRSISVDGFPALTAGEMQSYLNASHAYRYSGAQNQESTKSKCSAFVAGVYRRGRQAEKKYQALKKDLEADLPHTRFAKAIANMQPIYKRQRLETTWNINLDRLATAQQTAEYVHATIKGFYGWDIDLKFRFVYNVMSNTARIWLQGDLRDMASACTDTFTSESLPGLFLWTGYPITSAIESLLDQCKADVDKTWSTDWPLSVDRVELMSILERLKHYNESGNVKTLPYAALRSDPKAYAHLMLTGWPFMGNLVLGRNDGNNPNHRIRLWMAKIPWNLKTNTVALSATACVKFHYGLPAEQFYRAWALVSAKLQRIPVDFEPNMSSTRNMAYLIGDLIQEYQKGVVSMVTEYVLKDIKSQLTTGASAASNQFTAERKASILTWSKGKHPLSYGDTFDALCKSLSHSVFDAGKGLQFTEPRHISIEEFGHLLFAMGRPQHSAALSPPLWRPSSLLDTLRVTVQMFVCFIGKNLAQDRTMSDIFAAYVKVACNQLKINFGPWSEGGFPGSGYVRGKAVDRKVVPTVWCGFGNPPAPGSEVPVQLMDNNEAVGYRLRIAKDRAISLDTRADWAASAVLLGDYPIHFKRTINPTDFTATAAGINSKTSKPMYDIYSWALNTFNISNPVHHLALFTAMLYQKARPHLNWPSDAKAGAGGLFHPRASTPSSDAEHSIDDIHKERLVISRYVCQLEWCDGRTSKTALKEGDPFIPIFVTYFLAYFAGSESPLLSGEGKAPLGWADKHKRKYLHPINLIRTRLAVALPNGPGLFSGPRLNTHWTPLSTEKLTERHGHFKLVMEGSFGEMGMYSLLHQMFGHKVAARICHADDAPYPKTPAEFLKCPVLPDPFMVPMDDFQGLPAASHLLDDIPHTIPSFISPQRPKVKIRSNKKRMQIIESDSSSELSIDERMPRSFTTEAARISGKSVKPSLAPFPLQTQLSSKVSPLPNPLLKAKPSLMRLHKGPLPRENRPSTSDQTHRPSQSSSEPSAKSITSRRETASRRGPSGGTSEKVKSLIPLSPPPNLPTASGSSLMLHRYPIGDNRPDIVERQSTRGPLTTLRCLFPTLSSEELDAICMPLFHEELEVPTTGRYPDTTIDQLLLWMNDDQRMPSAEPPTSYLMDSGLPDELSKFIWAHAYGMQESSRTIAQTEEASDTVGAAVNN